MAGNPLIDQGVLNRLLSSVVLENFPALQVTPPYMNRNMVSLALDGEASKQLPSGTGVVQSPEPYIMATLTIHLLRTQQLAALYKQQLETNCLVGNLTVRGDSSVHPPYDLINCSIQSVRELPFSGEDAGYAVVIRGTYEINSSLWG